jgi:hypothetical protein
MSNDIESDNEGHIENNEADIEVSTPTTEPISEGFTCPICGKQFSKPTSMRMHMLKSHRATSKGEPPLTTETQAQVPDALSNLNSFLRIFGLSPKDSEAVCKYMENFDLNDLNRLNAALRDVAMPLPRRRLLIESWANVRNIQVPLNLQKELNIQPPSIPSYGHYGPFSPSPYGPYEQPQPKQEDLIDKLLKWEELKLRSQQSPNQVNPLENQYQMQIQTLQEQIRDLKESHTKEVQLLREQLMKKDQERLEEKIRSLEERLRSYERPSGDYKDDSIRLLAEAIREVGKKEPLDKIKELLPQILSAAYGIPQEKLQQQAPPQRQGLIQILKERGLVVPT